jgi:hypothetical protein
MSTFGDDTPAEDLYEWYKVVRDDYGLTHDEGVAILLRIASHVHDHWELKYEDAQKKKRGHIQ